MKMIELIGGLVIGGVAGVALKDKIVGNSSQNDTKQRELETGTSSELCHWLHFFRSMRNADGQTGAVFLLVKSGWARCPA